MTLTELRAAYPRAHRLVSRLFKTGLIHVRRLLVARSARAGRRR